LRLTQRLAACFVDRRNPALIEHEVATLLGQRLVGLALGYEDVNDHDALRHDPLFAALAGKLTALRSDCAPRQGDVEPARAFDGDARPLSQDQS
jgi:hypothetical protein